MYAIRSKGQNLLIRDGGSGEMKSVGPRQWVEYDNLPRGLTIHGDPSCEVKAIVCDEDLAAVLAENARMEGEDKANVKPKPEPKPEPEPVVKAAEPSVLEAVAEPEPPKSRRRK